MEKISKTLTILTPDTERKIAIENLVRKYGDVNFMEIKDSEGRCLSDFLTVKQLRNIKPTSNGE